MILQNQTEEKRLLLMKSNVLWAITHRGMVEDSKIFEHLKDIYDICFPMENK